MILPIRPPSIALPALLLLLTFSAGCKSTRPALRSAPVAKSAPDPFIDVTEAVGIHTVNQPAIRPMRLLESVGFGGGFVDFDSDGNLDVLLVSSPHCVLYRNAGNGSFVDVTDAAGLAAPGAWIGCAVGDYDNDSQPDLFISGYQRCVLYHNEGGGRFKDVTASSGVTATGRWFTAATFADFDRDGRLDLYVGAYCKFGPQARQYCVLHQNGVKTGCRPIDYDADRGMCFRNRRDGTFADVTRAWGLDRAHGKTLGAAVADFDADGWPDLYLANDEMPADLFHNAAGKGFVNQAVETGTAYTEGGKMMGGMGVDWGDFDGDGWLDLAVGTFESEPKSLFRSQGGKSFEYASPSAGILADTYPDVVFGTLLFDHDNDGALDLAFANGHTMDNIEQIRPTIPYRQPTRLFRNRGDATFTPVASQALAEPIAGRGLACGDYDNNGTLDLLVMDMDGKVRLLKNGAGDKNHWLTLDVRGASSNRDGLGARVSLLAGGKRQIKEVASARSYLSACDRRVHFGLGDTDRVEAVEVRWPSGRVSRLKDVTADQILQVDEAP